MSSRIITPRLLVRSKPNFISHKHLTFQTVIDSSSVGEVIMSTEIESTLQFGALKWEKRFLVLVSRDQLALEKLIKDNLLNNVLNLSMN